MRTSRTSTNSVYIPNRTIVTETRTNGFVAPPILNGVATVPNGDYRYTTSDPNWKSEIAARRNASGLYIRRSIEYELGLWNCTAQKWYDTYYGIKSNFTGRSNYLPAVWYPITDWELPDAALRDLALKRFKGKIEAQKGQVNALVPLVELREMRSLVGALALSGVDLVKALIDIKRTKGKSAAKFAGHAWLTWSFAVGPTLSEIDNIRDSIADYLSDKQDKMYRVSASASRDYHKNYTLFGYYCYSNDPMPGEVLVDTKKTYRFTAGYRMPVRSANNYGLSDHFGFKLQSLPSTLWELTAFSWLFDYFTTAGDFLEDTFESDGVIPLYITEAFLVKNVFEYYPRKPTPDRFGKWNGGYTFVNIEGTPSNLTHTYFSRTPISSIPSRSLRFKTSDEVGKNAVAKLLNLGSILIGGKAAISSKL